MKPPKIEPIEWDAPFTGATRMGLYNELFVATRLMVMDMVDREEHMHDGEPCEDVHRVINALKDIEEVQDVE